MKTGNPVQEMARLLLGLAIVAAITIAILSTLRGPAPGSATVAASPFPTSSPRQTATPSQEPITALPYPYPLENPLTSTAAAKQTAAGPINTQYMIMLATYLATTPSPTPPRTFPPTGTSEDMYVLASGEKMGLDVQNAWFGVLDERPVSVYAGALSGVPEQGAIYIFVELPSRIVNEQILTPTQHGGVRVVSEQNNRLTLVSTDGTTYYYDVPARRFVDLLTEIVPSATPPFTFTPLPTLPAIWISTPVPPTYNPYPAPTGQSTTSP
jgi:hypothetical protein